MARAIETAIAMGFGVDRFETVLWVDDAASRELEWTLGWAAFAQGVKHGGAAHLAAQSQAALLRSINDELPEGGSALVVSHGGVVELGTVGVLPGYDFSSWGASCERCEGVRLSFEGADCIGAELLRLEQLLPVS
jgi:broad specificity phosphatase PhoE